MSDPCVSVARSILLLGRRETGARLVRDQVLRSAGNVRLTTFRSAAAQLGAQSAHPELRFFEPSDRGRISFGPGAGLVVGVSVGAESVRAVLVDANGWGYHHFESERLANQLAAEPNAVLDRVKDAAGHVIAEAFEKGTLLVDGALPLLGLAIAWPTAIDRQYRPVSRALSHPNWRNGQPLTQRVTHRFKIRDVPVYALNDAHAAALAVAHRETRAKDHIAWTHPRMTVVLRLAGNVGGAVVVIEPKQDDPEYGPTSGFVSSVLLGGVDNHAGQIGHARVNQMLVDELNAVEVDGLGPLEAVGCSCATDDEPTPSHLEAYTSVLPLVTRAYPDRSRGDALSAILDKPDAPAHKKALSDIGKLVGDTLVAPVTMLNPAAIVLTGSLSLPSVHEEVEDLVHESVPFGTLPAVTALDGQDNDFVRATGAALAMLRNKVHRRLTELLDDERTAVAENVSALTIPLVANPF